MQLSVADVTAVFAKLAVDHRPSVDHVRGYLVVDGVRVLSLQYAAGVEPFPAGSADRFRRALRLSRDELQRLVGCTISRDEYVRMLNDRTGGW